MEKLLNSINNGDTESNILSQEFNFYPKEIGSNLRFAREAYFKRTNRTDRHKICEEAGIHYTQLSNFESGRRVPSLKVFAKLCDIYSADPAEVLGIVHEREGYLIAKSLKKKIKNKTGSKVKTTFTKPALE